MSEDIAAPSQKWIVPGHTARDNSKDNDSIS